MKEYIEILDKNIEANFARFAACSDDIAEHPEIGGEEFRTSRIFSDILKEAGFNMEYPACNIPTAFIGRIGKAGKGGRVALLTEYDALPEIGHACGHNLHGTMSLLAGVALAPIAEKLDAELMVVGTPAEETNGAKVAMSEMGLFDRCDMALMFHCRCGKTSAAYRSLALDAFEFTYTGKTSHAAAAPWDGLNALNAVQLLFHGIDMLRQHVRPETRMHGVITVGGTAPNIVPEKAAAQFYFRSPQSAYLKTVVEKIMNIAKGAAFATGTSLSWRSHESSFMNMIPNRIGEKLIEDIFDELEISHLRCEEGQGSSDVGDVSYRCPAFQPYIDINNGIYCAAHTKEFEAATRSEHGHAALKKAAKVLGRVAIKCFSDTELRKKMRDDFEKESRGA